MQKNSIHVFVTLFAAIATLAAALPLGAVPAVLAQSVNVSAVVQGVCGDGLIGPGEQCDDANLNGASCTSLGFSGGTLSCSITCSFDTSQCTSAPSGGGGGGGGGGGASTPDTSDATVVISGRAYPLTTVVISEDSEIRATVSADNNADFQATIQTTAGVHSFTVYGIDLRGRRSLQYTFTAAVSPNVVTAISGIFLSPTIDLDKSVVKKGNSLGVLGQTVPGSTVLVYVGSEHETVVSIIAQNDGTYYLAFGTTDLEYGTHTARSKSVGDDGGNSGFSETLSFRVGTEDVARRLLGDLNNDGKVNIVDLSIMLYWWRTTVPEGLTFADLNQDNKVDLVDLSIQLFHWTR